MTSTSCGRAPAIACGELHDAGVTEAYLYGDSAAEQPGTDGLNAFFLLVDRPEVYNLPPDPVAPRKTVARSWRSMASASFAMGVTALVSVLGRRR